MIRRQSHHLAKMFTRAFIVEVVKRLVTFGAQLVEPRAVINRLRRDSDD
jgi:hypothetical protein